jgi:hypothetical protein
MGCFAAGPTKLGEGVRSCLARAIERVEEVYRGPATCALVSEEGELRFVRRMVSRDRRGSR